MTSFDPRLVAIGRASSMLWAQIVEAVQAHGVDGEMRFGAMTWGVRTLAHMLRVSETELSIALETLAARGLIRWQKDVAIGLPPELMPSPRALAARVNGSKGGRPRKAVIATSAREEQANRVRLVAVTKETT